MSSDLQLSPPVSSRLSFFPTHAGRLNRRSHALGLVLLMAFLLSVSTATGVAQHAFPDARPFAVGVLLFGLVYGLLVLISMGVRRAHDLAKEPDDPDPHRGGFDLGTYEIETLLLVILLPVFFVVLLVRPGGPTTTVYGRKVYSYSPLALLGLRVQPWQFNELLPSHRQLL